MLISLFLTLPEKKKKDLSKLGYRTRDNNSVQQLGTCFGKKKMLQMFVGAFAFFAFDYYYFFSVFFFLYAFLKCEKKFLYIHNTPKRTLFKNPAEVSGVVGIQSVSTRRQVHSGRGGGDDSGTNGRKIRFFFFGKKDHISLLHSIFWSCLYIYT